MSASEIDAPRLGMLACSEASGILSALYEEFEDLTLVLRKQ